MDESDLFLDITPSTNLLASFRGERVNYILLICEGIDNAFDADASRIAVEFDAETICFMDNGNGVRSDKIEALFKLGEHGAQTTTALGRFGIGLKSQAVNAGDIMEVLSASMDGRFRARVDWREVWKNGIWRMPKPRWILHSIGETGTRILISELRKPPRFSMEELCREVASRFKPALLAGRVILINDGQIQASADPKIRDVVERQFNFSRGRMAHLHVGILVQPSEINRIHIEYLHRVIMPGSSLGCGIYAGIKRIFGRVQLSGQSWHLSQFKNGLADEEQREELEAAVFEAIEPLLRQVQTASIDAQIREMAARLNDRIPPEHAGARPHKTQKTNEKEEAKQRAKRSGKVAVDKSDPGGPARAPRTPRDTLKITFDGELKDGVGAFEPGRPHRVNLVANHSYIAAKIKAGDEDSLFAVAAAIYIHGRQSERPELPFRTLGEEIAEFLKDQRQEAATMA